ncbi:MAG: XdhC family protein [Chloracidobacterium sp.]|nr:XdhC family protein [Chloracidobacterium sp.]
MSNESELWTFIATRLDRGEHAALLVVTESNGSSPGRAGYKMAVAADGEMIGTIGGGVMEVSLVERARTARETEIVERIHRRDVVNSSGMICSGRQTVLIKPLSPNDLDTVRDILGSLEGGESVLTITRTEISVCKADASFPAITFEQGADAEFAYHERIASGPDLYIVGGGHCSLALSEVAARLGFRVHIFDDRPDLSTLAKNEFAHEVTTIVGYEHIGKYIPSGRAAYVVAMTLGYASDAVVIRQLIDHDVRYFGVLGSKAKIATMMKELSSEGLDTSKLDAIRTPIGLPINSRTPEEIAISIAAEIIAVKNT